ncbi:MAG: DNA repair protein RecN, partial [Desulfuromonadales bacterium]|nr:DNA repair protein RecN [Desulfuromonadales bacterium]
TGAGKSIIIDAVGLLLGDRARPELVRTGEEEATVEALFDLGGHPEVQNDLVEAGFEAAEELVVRRVISRGGKNRIYINGCLARLGQLEPLTSRLLAIYGQHEHQRLQRPDTHLELLDQFAALEAEVELYRHSFRQARELEERLTNLAAAERQRQQRLDLLTFQSRELAAAALKVGEEEELSAERLLLQHASRLAAIAEEGFEDLYGGEGTVCERLARLAGNLEAMAGIEPLFGSWQEAVRSALYALEDVARELRSYGDRIAYDPQRQNQVEERLAQLAALKRKYAPDVAGLLHYQGQIDSEIGELTDLESTREQLQKQLLVAGERRQQAGGVLSAARRQAAGRLRQAVEGELKALAMEKARFEVRFFELPEPAPRGLERAEFYLAPNPGEASQPLAAIASGGELSRIMLALNRAAPQAEAVPTLVFDEVDAGIGGAAATAVGEKLRGVAQGRQVLCITHLPQVAAFAQSHYQVVKDEIEGRTVTSVLLLQDEERIREMARMLGGARVTERTLEHAREIIAQSQAG